MEQFLRKLINNKSAFDDKWSETHQQVRNIVTQYEENSETLLVNKKKALNALVNYIHEESDIMNKLTSTKLILVGFIVKFVADDPVLPVKEVVECFHRLFDTEDIYNRWYLSCIEIFHTHFQIPSLVSTSESDQLIQSTLDCIKKHLFLNGRVDDETESKWMKYLSERFFSRSKSDSDALNNEMLMETLRWAYQQFFRSAVHFARQSNVWSSIVSTWSRTLPTLFDDYTNLIDSGADLALCVEQPVSTDFLDLIIHSYHSNVELYKTNSIKVLNVIETLISLKEFDHAYKFVDQVVIEHFNAVADVEHLIRKLLNIFPKITADRRAEFCQNFLSPITNELAQKKCPKELATLFFDLILGILNLCAVEAVKCVEQLLEKTDFYPWKELGSRLADLIRACAAHEKIHVDSFWSDLDSLRDILQIVVDRTKSNTTIFRAVHRPALDALYRWCESSTDPDGKIWSNHVYRMGEVLLDLVDVQRVDVDLCIDLTKFIRQSIKDNEKNEDEKVRPSFKSFFINLTGHLGKYLELLRNVPTAVHHELASFILLTLNYPTTDEKAQITFEHTLATQIWYRIGPCVTNQYDAREYELVIKKLFVLACENPESEYHNWWSTYWLIVGMKLPDVAVGYIDDFLADTIDQNHMAVATLLPNLYIKCPEPYHRRLNDVIHAIFKGDTSYLSLLGHLFWVIVKESPELVTSDQVDHLFTCINDQPNLGQQLHMIFQGLSFVATAKPQLFTKHQETLKRFIIEEQNFSAYECFKQYLLASTIIGGEQVADESLSILINLIRNNKRLTNEIRSQIFYTCQMIGVINKTALKSKRDELLEFNSFTECRSLIDFIDGNQQSEENQAMLKRTQNEIVLIEKRVVKTEDDVLRVDKTVKRQELKVTNLTERVNVADARLDDMNEQIEFHSQEIERIDAKTLSYVPTSWGRQVCELLNVKSDNDWRLLGKRFGYSASELRHWSTNADPCMALLNEWFSTHKTDEATYGLVKMLEEIGRKDAETIIRTAVAAAGELIPDDLPMEIKRLPPVFLSYQWGVQKTVENLKHHLEAAGYSCWMDTGQMGGGDKLFAKIDAGIRGAKVVICCMNEAYAQSDNCSREVHLCVSTGKPLIPLQMEKQTWPPEGALGPIMSEYLFIRFYDRKSNSQDYWPADKFSELLAQIRYHVAPDPDMITEQYKNWFVPQIDKLIFLQPKSTDENKPELKLTEDIALTPSHPQIMISYQWGRQADIVALYNQLTRLNYQCWLDIFQMGGGDSLFEKIDAGIRNAKCIIACVTPKYTKSVNCRREMALADALAKPIIPLLLEDTVSWPPPGPMALVFAEKQFIDFRPSALDAERENIWANDQFQMILDRLKIIIPEVQIESHSNGSIPRAPSTIDLSAPSDKQKTTPLSSPRNGTAAERASRTCSIL